MKRLSIQCATALLAFAFPGGPLNSQTCQRVALGPALTWISQLQWVDERKQVAVVDPHAGILALYGLDGKQTKPKPDLNISRRPTGLTKAPGGYLLKLAGSRVLKLDEQFRSQGGEFDLREVSNGPNGAIGSLYDWTVAGDYLVAYGSIRDSADAPTFRLAFFRAPLSNPSDIEILKDFEAGEEQYVATNSLFTSIGSDAYFVLMDPKNPALMQVSSSGKLSRLSAFPRSLAERWSLDSTKMTGPSTDAELYDDLATQTMPFGLLSHGDRLYLLGREPNGKEGATKWTLYRVDPARDILEGQVALPTVSSHISIATSPDNFLVFERGRVGQDGGQNIASMILINSSVLSSRGPNPSLLRCGATTIRR